MWVFHMHPSKFLLTGAVVEWSTMLHCNPVNAANVDLILGLGRVMGFFKTFSDTTLVQIHQYLSGLHVH